VKVVNVIGDVKTPHVIRDIYSVPDRGVRFGPEVVVLQPIGQNMNDPHIGYDNCYCIGSPVFAWLNSERCDALFSFVGDGAR
jgi:hypothetical protein